VDWEGQPITSKIYDARDKTYRFAPVVFDSQDTQFIPEPFSVHTPYLLESEDNYDNLYAFLTGQAGVSPSGLGPLKPLVGKDINAFRSIPPIAVSDRRDLLILRDAVRRRWLSGEAAVLERSLGGNTPLLVDRTIITEATELGSTARSTESK